MHAIIDLADQSSRMKDYYDMYHLLSSFSFDRTVLQEAIVRTFQNRHTPYIAETRFFNENFPVNSQLQMRWTAFLRKSAIKIDLTFSEVARWLQNELRSYWNAYGNQ
jgi:ethanolamine utilization cobalamin adenosyltransferase